MIYIQWAIIIAYTFIVIAAIVKVLLDNRQPVKTMAWIMVMSFVPVFGLMLYFFFGRNTRKMRFISQRSLDQLTKRSMLEFVEQRDLRLPERYRTLIQLFANQSLSLPFKNTSADIFNNGYEYFSALLKEIGRAKDHIHIDVYIIDDAPLGRLIADALIDKSPHGVEVRLVYDDVGCWNVSNRFFEHLREGGVDVHAFMPVNSRPFPAKSTTATP